jgi:hypothetical protein
MVTQKFTKGYKIMFRCALSGKNSIPGQSPVRVVTQTRQKTYVNYKEVIENEKKKLIEVISEGWEIVEEKLVLPEVAKALNNGQEEKLQTERILTRRGEAFKRGDKETKEV